MARLGLGLGLTAPTLFASGGASTPPPPDTIITVNKLHQDGDSITYDPNPFSYGRAFAAKHPGITVTNVAVSSAGIGSPGDAAGANSLYGRKQLMVDANPDLATIFIGANDLGNMSSAQAWIDALDGYLTTIETLLPGLPVGVAGVLEISETGGFAYLAPTNNPRRVTANAWMRQAVGSKIAVYIPFGDAVDQAWSRDPLNLYDGLHPENNGRALMAEIYAAVVDPIVAKATGTVPAPFTVIDQNNVPAGTTIERSFIVTGLGLGKVATFSATGGQIARGRMGNPAFGSIATAMNGDLIRWRVTASSEADTLVTSTVSSGSRSETFEVRSAKAVAPLTFTSSPDVRTIERSGGSASPFNFLAVQFPEGRPIVALDMTYYLASSVTVNGIALSQVEAAGNNSDGRQMVWVAPAGTNLAAGEYDVTVTTAYNMDCVMWPAAIKGTGSAELQTRRIPFGNKAIGNHSSALLPVPSGALAVSFFKGSAGVTTVFPEATAGNPYPATKDTDSGLAGLRVARWVTTGASTKPTYGNHDLSWSGMVTILFQA